MLMEQLDYNLLFRWFVGLNMDDSIWDVTVFTKNRERTRRAENESAGHRRMQPEPFPNHKITETGENLSRRVHFSAACYAAMQTSGAPEA
jgi:hypothetical protein